MEDILGVGEISNIILGCLKFLIFFLGDRMVDAGPEPMYEETRGPETRGPEGPEALTSGKELISVMIVTLLKPEIHFNLKLKRHLLFVSLLLKLMESVFYFCYFLNRLIFFPHTVKLLLTLWMLGYITCFFCRLLVFFSQLTFSKYSFRNTITGTVRLDQ